MPRLKVNLILRPLIPFCQLVINLIISFLTFVIRSSHSEITNKVTHSTFFPYSSSGDPGAGLLLDNRPFLLPNPFIGLLSVSSHMSTAYLDNRLFPLQPSHPSCVISHKHDPKLVKSSYKHLRFYL